MNFGRYSIVSIASTAGIVGGLGPHVYTMAKHGVVGLTRQYAVSFAKANVRVNAICPTSVNTPMANTPEGQPQLNMEKKSIPLGRIAEPEEIAAIKGNHRVRKQFIRLAETLEGYPEITTWIESRFEPGALTVDLMWDPGEPPLITALSSGSTATMR